ncbi:MAG: phosphatase PAP2 family protein [Nitrospirae bacterium]|nr:phosphatase PAP2 family protein [Candidatus Manganitrophaceae bacterium]
MSPGFVLSAELSQRGDQITVQGEPTAETGLLSVAYGKRVLRETGDILSSPARWERRAWLVFSLESAAVGAAFTLDRSIRNAAQRSRTQTTDDIAKIVEPFGAEYSLVILGGFYLTGLVLDDPKAQAVAQDGVAASLIASGLITSTLKEVVGRSRPSQGERVYHFQPFSGSHSFPSGHTTEAFVMASVLSAHYDSPSVKTISYGLATLVGFARIEHNAHFASDVMAGALIGASVGNATVHFNEKQESQISFRPWIDQNERGMIFTVRF